MPTIQQTTTRQTRSGLTLIMVAALWLGFCGSAFAAGPDAAPSTYLDRGFVGLYNLDFAGAQRDFTAWETQHPDDPVGPVSQAAGYLFSEFNRLGVLEGQFYDTDKAFTHRSTLTPDPAIHNEIEAALERSDRLAHARLVNNDKDPDALFALTLGSGLQADYAALIEKRNLTSLHYTKRRPSERSNYWQFVRIATTRKWPPDSAST